MYTIPAQTFDGYTIPETDYSYNEIYGLSDFNGRWAIYCNNATITLNSSGRYTLTLSPPYAWMVASDAPTGFQTSHFTYDSKKVYYYGAAQYTGANYNDSRFINYPVVNPWPSDWTSSFMASQRQGRIGWLMVYGNYEGFGIIYNLNHATGAADNPTIQVPGVFPSYATFTADFGYKLTSGSVDITYGAPDYDPFDDYEFDPVTGVLQIGEIEGEIIVTVRAAVDPYAGGGTSETGGGEGTYGEDRFGDGIDDETIDTPDYDPLDQFNRSVLGSQFVDVYAPSRTELQSLKNYLWSSSISDTLKKMFNNPMDCIVTLHMVPVSVPSIASNIFVGGSDTGIASSHVTNQYVTVNCGSMSIGEYWDAYLDYSPYTKMFLYLPFCGMHEIDVDEVMGQTISIRYDVDVVSGDCLCSISATRSGGMSTVLYQYAGNCSVEIPVSMANYNARVSAYLGLVGSAAGVVAGVASGGMSAPLAATALASSAANIATAKKSIQRSGAIAGSTAWMSQLKPYFILVQPSQCLPANQAHFTGYPSFITAAVGELSGYTEFAEIHLEGISATDSEKAEIEAILKGGVLI